MYVCTHITQHPFIQIFMIQRVAFSVFYDLSFLGSFSGASLAQPSRSHSAAMACSKHAKAGSSLLSKYRLGNEPMFISVDAMVQDPSNRAGEGVKIAEVLLKAQSIEEQGFDLSKVRVVLVQMPLDPRLRDEIFAKNKEWRADDHRYPVFDENLVEYSIVGGNHLVVGMQMMKCGTQCDSFCSVKKADGTGAKMSLTLLETMDPDYAEAVKGKIPCVVLRREVREEVGALQSIR